MDDVDGLRKQSPSNIMKTPGRYPSQGGHILGNNGVLGTVGSLHEPLALCDSLVRWNIDTDRNWLRRGAGYRSDSLSVSTSDQTQIQRTHAVRVWKGDWIPITETGKANTYLDSRGRLFSLVSNHICYQGPTQEKTAWVLGEIMIPSYDDGAFIHDARKPKGLHEAGDQKGAASEMLLATSEKPTPGPTAFSA